jgi:hypothetical protein
MFEAIIFKLVTTLTGYLFQGYLDSFLSINIEGAPGWYGKNQSSANVYAYGYAKGGMESIEIARDNCHIAMVKKLNGLVEVVVYDNFKDVKDVKEKALLNEFKKDPEINIFVQKNMKYEKVEHFEEEKGGLFTKAHPAQTFAGGMIPKQLIITYQKDRLEKIKYSLTHFRATNAEDELDKEVK